MRNHEITVSDDTLQSLLIQPRLPGEIIHDQLIASIDIIYVTVVQVDSEIIHATVMTTYTHQISIVSEIEIHAVIVNIRALIHLCPTFHVSDVVARNTLLQIANVSHLCKKSKRA